MLDLGRADSPLPHGEDMDIDPLDDPSDDRHIRVEYHPHAKKPDERILIDRRAPSIATSTEHDRGSALPELFGRTPWAPFRTRADAEFADIAVRARMTGDILKDYLRAASTPKPLHNIDDPRYQAPYHWHEKSNITFTSVKDYEDSLARARKYVQQVISLSLLTRWDLA
jgi:hypothetical protein